MKVKKNMEYRKYNYEYSNRAKNNITCDKNTCEWFYQSPID